MLIKYLVKAALSGRRTFGVTIIGLLFAFDLSNAFAQTLPVIHKPTGSYTVGTLEFSLIDRSRPEAFTVDPNDKRELYIRVWYPAQNVSGDAKPLPVFGKPTKQIADAIAGALRLPKGSLDYLALVPSHSYADAPLAVSKEKFPVIVFSHGYYLGFAAQNAAQMEELASHGYVVFGIGHTFETIVNVFPDGHAVPAAAPLLLQPNPKANELDKKYAEAKTAAERAEYAKQLVLVEPANERLKIWTADVQFVLDEIERLNAGKTKSIFAKKLDTGRTGVIGMSFGGATTGQVCVIDKRCRAGVSLDGPPYGDLYAKGLARPFMFFHAESTAPKIARDIYDAAKPDAYYLMVKGTKHLNFSNFDLLSAFDKGERLGTISGDRMEKIMSSYVLAFFNKYLKNTDSQLLQKASPDFTEVSFSAKRAK